jgi:hypothetical protein
MPRYRVPPREHLFRRASPVFEWALAVGLLVVAVGIGTTVVRDLLAVRGDTARPMTVFEEALPPSVLGRGVSLPFLLFDDGKRVRVGDSASYVATLLGRGAEVGRQEIDQVATGERLTRFYEYRSRRFALVFRLAESRQDPTVIAIYLA